MGNPERRRFPRVNLPMVYRPAGLLGPRKPARDISRGGIRVLTDDPIDVGSRLTIEIFLPSGSSISVDVRVAWTAPAEDREARYEAGLEFLITDALQLASLESLLDEYEAG